jgi:iron-sulfur cluster repair protein YtfE (RIC family)
MNVESSESEVEVIESIEREHEALREKLRFIHEALAAHHLRGEKLAELLHNLHDTLVVHFSNEEFHGFFGEITARAPQLKSSADKLCAEHQAMLHRASELVRFAAAGTGSEAWWRELRSGFQVFSKELMHHESNENALLQRAYQEDIGTND